MITIFFQMIRDGGGRAGEKFVVVINDDGWSVERL